MKICLVQSSSEKGEILHNISNHVRMIETAIESNADLIVFPELSITGYEPKLAKELVCKIEDERFHPFQELANRSDVTICIGTPTIGAEGIQISMIIFQPYKKHIVYSKQRLHDDELPYFVSGSDQSFILSADIKIAFGICYETLSREHFVEAIESQAQLYIASVAKPDRGIEKAYLHFPAIAKEFNIPILMTNSVGYCDNFLSKGKSAAWNGNGELLAQLDEENQGLLIYDTELKKAHKLKIEIHNGD